MCVCVCVCVCVYARACADDAKRLLKEAVVMPIKYPMLFQGLLSPWKGVLLYGPPGTGKTMLAKAVATECKTTFFNISASSIVSKWRGDSEKLVRVLFELARYHKPSTIFLDEIDSIMSQRQSGGQEHDGGRRMKTELLIQMDGVMASSDLVFLLCASNLPWDLDSALLRRLEKRIFVPLPGPEARKCIVQKHLNPDRAPDIDFEMVVAKTEGFSGSDVVLLCKEAAMRPLRRIMKQLESGDGCPACMLVLYLYPAPARTLFSACFTRSTECSELSLAHVCCNTCIRSVRRARKAGASDTRGCSSGMPSLQAVPTCPRLKVQRVG